MENKQRKNTRSESKPVREVLSESLAKESQEAVDRAFNKANGAFKATTDYVTENPKEAIGLAVTAAMAAWALLGTKPGRRVFDVAAGTFVPQATRWIRSNLSAAVENDKLTH